VIFGSRCLRHRRPVRGGLDDARGRRQDWRRDEIQRCCASSSCIERRRYGLRDLSEPTCVAGGSLVQPGEPGCDPVRLPPSPQQQPLGRLRRRVRHEVGSETGRWFCYVLQCADGTFYTGITTSIERRLALHNRGRASRYTRGRLPVRLVYAAPYEDRSSASRREIEVKKMSPAEKRRLGTTNANGPGAPPAPEPSVRSRPTGGLE